MTTDPVSPVSSAPAARFRLPAAAPEPVSDAERAAFAQLAQDSLPAVRASAQSWRNGLTALVSLAAAGVFVQGRSATAELTTTWRGVVTVLIGGGLVAAGVGLWYALAAEAGGRAAPMTLPDIHARHASVAAYQVALANRSANRLHRARVALGVALALLIAGALVTWWAPAALPASPAADTPASHRAPPPPE
ncbi:hypothetical protein [Micromonospora sp. NBC_01813]|uniref:hypothetical protein n=1 Tax=Micromonospora sp. NBC_01813 TaxID=2975988 RepID=UPI002DDB0F84|nr:hypothetical protein [Micromonospora sp. NBC_01813]WSA12023.1 hypothetical protein OG958_15285 [Micromonospora sp. NBC_01813]